MELYSRGYFWVPTIMKKNDWGKNDAASFCAGCLTATAGFQVQSGFQWTQWIPEGEESVWPNLSLGQLQLHWVVELQGNIACMKNQFLVFRIYNLFKYFFFFDITVQVYLISDAFKLVQGYACSSQEPAPRDRSYSKYFYDIQAKTACWYMWQNNQKMLNMSWETKSTMISHQPSSTNEKEPMMSL